MTTTEAEHMADRQERAAVALAAYCHQEGREVVPTDPQELINLIASVISDLGHLLDSHTPAPGQIGVAIKLGIGVHYRTEVENLRFEQDILRDLENLDNNESEA